MSVCLIKEAGRSTAIRLALTSLFRDSVHRRTVQERGALIWACEHRGPGCSPAIQTIRRINGWKCLHSLSSNLWWVCTTLTHHRTFADIICTFSPGSCGTSAPPPRRTTRTWCTRSGSPTPGGALQSAGGWPGLWRTRRTTACSAIRSCTGAGLDYRPASQSWEYR